VEYQTARTLARIHISQEFVIGPLQARDNVNVSVKAYFTKIYLLQGEAMTQETVGLFISKVTRADVEKAFRATGRIPRNRDSTEWCLVMDGRHLPPKVVLGKSAVEVVGEEVPWDDISGGVNTNSVLENLGFEVIRCGTRNCQHEASEAGPQESRE
jgi:hypothetical protein